MIVRHCCCTTALLDQLGVIGPSTLACHCGVLKMNLRCRQQLASGILLAAPPTAMWLHSKFCGSPFVGAPEKHQNRPMHVYRVTISMRGRGFKITQNEAKDTQRHPKLKSPPSPLILPLLTIPGVVIALPPGVVGPPSQSPSPFCKTSAPCVNLDPVYSWGCILDNDKWTPPNCGFVEAVAWHLRRGVWSLSRVIGYNV